MSISSLLRTLRPGHARAGQKPTSFKPYLERLEDRSLLSATPIDVIGHLPAAEYNQFIANVLYLGSVYKDWGNEPSVAVNPLNPSQIVVSTFAYAFPRASLWYSTDGGADWDIRFPIPNSPAPGQGVPGDQTFAYDSNGVLHGALLTYPLSKNGPAGNIFQGSTSDPAADGQAGQPDDWRWNTQRVNLPNSTQNKADQPWIAVSGDHVYVAYGDGLNQNSVQAHVSASSDGGATFTQDNPISKRSQWAAYNPGIRIAADQAGRVYAFFEIGEGPLKSGQPLMTHYRLNVSFDAGATWAYTDSSAEGGIPVADGPSLQQGVSFGGVNTTASITAIAADPTGAHVYVTYGMKDATGADRIYLAEFHPDASGNLVERANPVALSVAGQRSALPSVAVTANGSIAVQYDTFTDADGQFHVHLATSTDQGQTFTDQDLSDFTATGIPFPFPGATNLLGDYQDLVAVGNTVFGTFAARGNVNDASTGINTTDKIDPFVYSVRLPGEHLNSLPEIASNTAGTASSADASSSTSGAPRFFGAAMPDRFGAEFPVLSEVPAVAPAFALPLPGQAVTLPPSATTADGGVVSALVRQSADDFFAAIGREDGNWGIAPTKRHAQDETGDLLGDFLSQGQWWQDSVAVVTATALGRG